MRAIRRAWPPRKLNKPSNHLAHVHRGLRELCERITEEFYANHDYSYRHDLHELRRLDSGGAQCTARVEAEVSYDQGRAVIMRPGEVGTERLLETIRAKGYGADLTQATERASSDRGSEQGLHIAVIGSGGSAMAAALKSVERVPVSP
ncbi:hypothetical protein HSBAA_PA_2960 (plasmid) [Vreelandella sulfidaeris]|uniref:Uncharacterized protein n=1 Tax=Vreelandella sulfidaeris TaxID=115553 RepID=A0A455UK02_9GAMM|nr:hypothetical protein HSBAA_PA_2960 [Halomonas sulfidaeris]